MSMIYLCLHIALSVSNDAISQISALVPSSKKKNRTSEIFQAPYPGATDHNFLCVLHNKGKKIIIKEKEREREKLETAVRLQQQLRFAIGLEIIINFNR